MQKMTFCTIAGQNTYHLHCTKFSPIIKWFILHYVSNNQTNFLKIDFSLNILHVYFSYLRQHFQTQFAFCAYFTIVLRRILSLVIIGIDISVHGYVMNKGWPRSGWEEGWRWRMSKFTWNKPNLTISWGKIRWMINISWPMTPFWPALELTSSKLSDCPMLEI